MCSLISLNWQQIKHSVRMTLMAFPLYRLDNALVRFSWPRNKRVLFVKEEHSTTSRVPPYFHTVPPSTVEASLFVKYNCKTLLRFYLSSLYVHPELICIYSMLFWSWLNVRLFGDIGAGRESERFTITFSEEYIATLCHHLSLKIKKNIA